jgi:hypothetical protein
MILNPCSRTGGDFVDETRRAWDEVGEGFAKLGRIISERHRQLGEESASGTSTPADASVADAIRRATDELDRAFTSLGDTLRDDEARKQVRDTGDKLSEALKVTLSAVSEEVRRTLGGQPPGKSDSERPDPPADIDSSR